MKTEPGYEPLARVLTEALDQAQHGKGKKCHANGKPFIEQEIMSEGRSLGVGGHVFQVRKKVREAMNCTDDSRAIEDLLGAIVYTAAMVLLRREQKQDEIIASGPIDYTHWAVDELSPSNIAKYLGIVKWDEKSPEVLLAVREAYVKTHGG